MSISTEERTVVRGRRERPRDRLPANETGLEAQPARFTPGMWAVILFVSSELAEFPLVCDRVLTLFGGRITAELQGEAADEATLLRAMHGIVEDEAAA